MRTARLLSLLVLTGGLSLSACDSLAPDAPGGQTLHFTNDPSIATRLQRVAGTPQTVAGKTQTVTLDVVGKVAPMTISGATAFANGIQLVDGKVFVTYITPGNAFGGGIDLLDPSDPMNTRSAKSSFSDVFDVSGVAVRGDAMYVSGSVKEGTATGAGTIKKDNGAFVIQTSVSDMETSTAFANLESGDVTDIAFGSDGNLYATSGATGRAYTLSTSLKTLASWKQNELRSILPAAGGVYALSGKGLHFSATGVSSSRVNYQPVLTLDGLTTAGLARMSQSEGYLYVPLNRGGLSVLDQRTNKEVTRVQGGTFNGVAAVKDFVFVANADGGLVAYQWNATRTVLTDARRIDLDGLEANHVVYANGYLFVAAADGGVRIVRVDVS